MDIISFFGDFKVWVVIILAIVSVVSIFLLLHYTGIGSALSTLVGFLNSIISAAPPIIKILFFFILFAGTGSIIYNSTMGLTYTCYNPESSSLGPELYRSNPLEGAFIAFLPDEIKESDVPESEVIEKQIADGPIDVDELAQKDKMSAATKNFFFANCGTPENGCTAVTIPRSVSTYGTAGVFGKFKTLTTDEEIVGAMQENKGQSLTFYLCRDNVAAAGKNALFTKKGYCWLSSWKNDGIWGTYKGVSCESTDLPSGKTISGVALYRMEYEIDAPDLGVLDATSPDVFTANSDPVIWDSNGWPFNMLQAQTLCGESDVFDSQSKVLYSANAPIYESRRIALKTQYDDARWFGIIKPSTSTTTADLEYKDIVEVRDGSAYVETLFSEDPEKDCTQITKENYEKCQVYQYQKDNYLMYSKNSDGENNFKLENSSGSTGTFLEYNCDPEEKGVYQESPEIFGLFPLFDTTFMLWIIGITLIVWAMSMFR